MEDTLKELRLPITADTPEKFQKLYEELKTLPTECLQGVVNVKTGLVGIEITVDHNQMYEKKYWLPESARQITDFQDYIGIYCDKWFIKIINLDLSKGLPTFCIIKS